MEEKKRSLTHTMLALATQPHVVNTAPRRVFRTTSPSAVSSADPLDWVSLSPKAAGRMAPPNAERFGFSRISRSDLPPTFCSSYSRSGQSKGVGGSSDESSIGAEIKNRVSQMWSNFLKAIGGFSKALPALSGEKGKTMRAIISALRGFGGVASALESGNIKGIINACKGFGEGLKRVAEVSGKKSLGFLLRRGGAFIPVLGTGLEGYSCSQALEKAAEAKKSGNSTAAAIWAGSAALHSLSATLSGTVDLVLLLTAGVAGPAYGVLNGVVSGLGAVADIAGGLTE